MKITKWYNKQKDFETPILAQLVKSTCEGQQSDSIGGFSPLVNGQRFVLQHMAKYHNFFLMKNTLSWRDMFFLFLKEKALNIDTPESLEALIQPHEILINLSPKLHTTNTGVGHCVKKANAATVTPLGSNRTVKNSGMHHLATQQNGIHKLGSTVCWRFGPGTHANVLFTRSAVSFSSNQLYRKSEK